MDTKKWRHLLGRSVLIGSLLWLGACAHRSVILTEPPVVARPAAPKADSPFLVNTKVFLVKKPDQVPLLKLFSTKGATQTHVLPALAGSSLLAELRESKHATEDYGNGSIMTVSGKPVVYEAIHDLVYPTEYDPPKLPADAKLDTAGGFPVTPASPVKFETTSCGFQSQVTPYVRKGGLLDVLVKAESTTFDGFKNYGSPIQAPTKNWLGKPIAVTLTENRVEVPVFTTGKVESTVRAQLTDFVVITGMPQGRPLNEKLEKSELLSGKFASTEARSAYQLVVLHEILTVAE